MLKNKYRARVGATIPLLILLNAILGGCAFDRWLSLEPGLYRLGSNMAAARFVESLEVDRDNGLATFRMPDGATTVVSFTSRDRSDWPTGCPANIGATYMEVLDIQDGPLAIGELSFEEPILVRDCASDQERIALRENGLVGGGGSACMGLGGCLTFVRQSQAALVLTAPIVNAKPLPSSMKGYELYSWRDEVDDNWRYTLITGTNCLKTVQEIVAEENLVTPSEWVKITARGTEDLKTLLERLPPGTYLSWQGGDRLGIEQRAAINFGLPSSRAVQAIQEHCRHLDIQLNVSQ
ncbi:MAG: hypothetical protein JSW55_08180 [Chloroflexota bacterium]|nr:MAG: hypothetical protein JSW55_08180 [Chloroflexota bacterium]